jgi:uncharacterized protein (DUF1697 family)
MNSWIVLLRGINVGGKNTVPMKQLTEMLVGLGCQNVETYIQSGNVLLKHAESNKQVLSKQIAEQMYQTFGFTPQILLLTLAECEQAVANNHFLSLNLSLKHYMFFFSLSLQPLQI